MAKGRELSTIIINSTFPGLLALDSKVLIAPSFLIVCVGDTETVCWVK